MFAVIDLGSNSFHLLIARHTDLGFTVIDRCSEKIQLADGLSRHGKLTPAAMQRGLDCLRRFNKTLARHPIRYLRVVATQALREASNAAAFVQAVEKLGLRIEIISGEQEAALIYRGVCDPLPDSEHKRLIIDIGGASTEIAIGDSNTIHLAKSLPMGCVSWRDRFFSEGDEYGLRCQEAAQAARAVLAPHIQALKALGWSEVYASSGSAKMLSRIGLANTWTKGEITRACVDRIQDAICHIRHHEDIALSGLKPERRDLLAPGSSIMSAIMESLSIDHVHYSRTALREGILGDMSGHRVDYQLPGDHIAMRA